MRKEQIGCQNMLTFVLIYFPNCCHPVITISLSPSSCGVGCWHD